MPEQELHRPQVLRSPADQRCLRTAHLRVVQFPENAYYGEVEEGEHAGIVPSIQRGVDRPNGRGWSTASGEARLSYGAYMNTEGVA